MKYHNYSRLGTSILHGERIRRMIKDSPSLNNCSLNISCKPPPPEKIKLATAPPPLQ